MDVEKTLGAARVKLCRKGENPWLVCRMSSGWLVMCDKQVQSGQVILLSDPYVFSLNDLSGEARTQYLNDMALVGDALLEATDAYRVNYEILGNTDQVLHAHIIPRYLAEPKEKRAMPIWFYDWEASPDFSEKEFGEIRRNIRAAIEARL